MSPVRRSDGRYFRDPESRTVTQQDIADILRGVAIGLASQGEPERARILRKRARQLEGRDGPGEPYRKHR
jgi:hypothetical protein